MQNVPHSLRAKRTGLTRVTTETQRTEIRQTAIEIAMATAIGAQRNLSIPVSSVQIFKHKSKPTKYGTSVQTRFARLSPRTFACCINDFKTPTRSSSAPIKYPVAMAMSRSWGVFASLNGSNRFDGTIFKTLSRRRVTSSWAGMAIEMSLGMARKVHAMANATMSTLIMK